MDYKEQMEVEAKHYRMLAEYHWKEFNRAMDEFCEAMKECREYLERAVKSIEER